MLLRECILLGSLMFTMTCASAQQTGGMNLLSDRFFGLWVTDREDGCPELVKDECSTSA